MTAVARRVLGDCEAALETLEEERNERRWRVLWVGAMALLRAVGHVLRKVDGEVLRQGAAIDAAYQGWTDLRPEHAVFRDFIEDERNNILKEYRLNIVGSVEVSVAAVVVDPDERRKALTGFLQAHLVALRPGRHRQGTEGRLARSEVKLFQAIGAVRGHPNEARDARNYAEPRSHGEKEEALRVKLDEVRPAIPNPPLNRRMIPAAIAR